MDRECFINEIFAFYNKSSDDALKKSYNLAFSYPKPIDWDKLYMYCLKESETRYLPPPKWFVSKFPQFEIRTIEQTKLDGYQIRVYFKSGRFNDFTICKCGRTLNDIVERFRGNDDVIRAEMYEPHVTLMVNHIYPENAEAKLIYSI